MKLFISFLILCLAGIVSCSKTSQDQDSNNNLNVKVTFQKDFGTDVDTAVRYPDAGAKIFLYKGLDPVHDILHTDNPSYTSEGSITLKDGTIRKPDASATISTNGTVNFSNLPTQRIAILAISKYYPGQGRLTSTAFGDDGYRSKLINLNFFPAGWPK